MLPPKKVPAYFYRTISGNEPVREWLLSLNEVDRHLMGVDIATVEYGWPVGMPLSQPLGLGLHELRTHLSDGKIARLIFAVEDGRLLLLHGFIKKTRKLPQADWKLALKRLKEMWS